MFINHLKQLVDEQGNEIERAVIGRGKYKFHVYYSHLEIKEREWFKTTRDQRERHMKMVASTQLSAGSDKTLSVNTPEPPVGSSSHISQLVQKTSTLA